VGEAPYAVRRGAVAAKLCAIETVLADPATVVLKHSPRVTVARVGSGEHQLVLKRFREAAPLRVLEALFVGSRALRVWRAAALMRAAGFAVPEPVAALEDRRFGVLWRSCAIARWVVGAPLDEVWRARRGRARRALTLAFADYLRRLHAAGLYPQDLRAANVLVTSEDPARFVLVDLDRVRRYRRLAWGRRRKNVVQVHRSVGRDAPLAEGLRFLRGYLGDPSRAELRRVATEIATLGRRKDAEYARRRGEVARPS
jgi:hypothetical protein